MPELNFSLSQSKYSWIGERIYQNECASKPENLLFWNQNEPFPSLGIGHFIWLPKGVTVPFEAAFPLFIQFLKTHYPNKSLPLGLADYSSAPWASREAFEAQKRSGDLTPLQIWLESEFAVQADFIVQRFKQRLPELLQALSSQERKQIQRKIETLLQSEKGIFALIDYSNFKGFGTNPKERYQNKGWGLLQVLQAMPNESSASSAQPVELFIRAAKQVLERRVALSPNRQTEQKWLKGWFIRLDGYRQ